MQQRRSDAGTLTRVNATCSAIAYTLRVPYAATRYARLFFFAAFCLSFAERALLRARALPYSPFIFSPFAHLP